MVFGLDFFNAAYTLEKVASAPLAAPAFSNLVERYPDGNGGFAPALLQTSFGPRTQREAISVVRNVGDIFNGVTGTGDIQVEEVSSDVTWPNEAEVIPEDVTIAGINDDEKSGYLVGANGFFASALGPFGKGDGTGHVSIYGPDGTRTQLTEDEAGYFYHVSHFHDMNGDGRPDIVTARAKVPIVNVFGSKAPMVPCASTELLWLEQPVEGINGEWKTHSILEGSAGVNFKLVNLDNDDKMQILTAEFFAGKQLSVIECTGDNWSDCTDGNKDLNVVVIDNDDQPDTECCPLDSTGDLVPCNLAAILNSAGGPGGPPPGVGGPGGPPPGVGGPGGPPSGGPGGPGGPPRTAYKRYFNVEMADLNDDGKLDVLATYSPHVANNGGAVLAFEQPEGDWRVGEWTQHILLDTPEFDVDSSFNGSPGDAHAFYPVAPALIKKESYKPSILLSGDDAGFVMLFTPKRDLCEWSWFRFSWQCESLDFEYNVKVLTQNEVVVPGKANTIGAPGVKDVNGDGIVDIVIPKYSLDTIEFWTYKIFSCSRIAQFFGHC